MINEAVRDAVLAVPEDEPGPKILLMGAPGSGKTYSIASLVEAGLEVFVIFTEQGRESLLEGMRAKGLPKDKVHWASVAPGSPGFAALLKVAKDINTKTQSELQGAKGVSEKQYQQMIDLIGLCHNFVDQHGVEFGDVTTWDNKRVLVVDGLSGLNIMAMDLVVGAKPIKTIADWGIAMDAEMRFIHQCVNSLICTFVLVAHLEINRDEVDGRMYKFPALLGNKNSYSFGKHFSDVILCQADGKKRYWDTIAKDMQLKTRNLPEATGQAPDFVPLIKTWSERYADYKFE